jgi:uncharacterized protein (TIGR03435 family)
MERKASFSRGARFTLAILVVFIVSTVFGVSNAAQAGVRPQAQGLTATAPAYEYEIASIKQSAPLDGGDTSGFGMQYTPDGFTASHFPLKALIISAFGVGLDRISGMPNWSDFEMYDIEAKMESSTADKLKKLSPDELRVVRQQMLQALLVNRFKLTFHRESKELPVFFLVVGKNGPKVRESKPSESSTSEIKGRDGQPLSKGANQMRMELGAGGTIQLTAPGTPIKALLGALSGQLGRPVIDRTGLTGNYDISLEWAPEQDSNGPSLQTAVQDQLGLKLESGKGPIEIIVIDHLERPSKN